MSGADYLHCAACGAKALYDADVNYDYPNLGALVALCKECRKTHTLKPMCAVPVPESIRATAIDAAAHAIIDVRYPNIGWSFVSGKSRDIRIRQARAALAVFESSILPAVVAQVQADTEASILETVAAQIPEQMRMDELGLHDLYYTDQLPQPSKFMLNGATRFAERLRDRAAAIRAVPAKEGDK